MSYSFEMSDPSSASFDSSDPDLLRKVVCYLNDQGTGHHGNIGARVSAVFVFLVVATTITLLPLLATKTKWFRMPAYVHHFARYFGAGIIVATAFIHLLQPAYESIGPASCVGLTNGWAGYAWPPALALTSAMMTFLMEFAADRYVQKNYGCSRTVSDEESVAAPVERCQHQNHQAVEQKSSPNNQDAIQSERLGRNGFDKGITSHRNENPEFDFVLEGKWRVNKEKERLADISFKQQITGFAILDFGILFHSAIIGVSFEGLGIGARLAGIPFPKKLKWLPWLLCIAYGLTTPVSIALALSVRSTYDASSFTGNVVSGILDAVSAGILIYTGFVELIAKDFLFNPKRPDNDKQLAFMIASLLLGAAVMALLGKWA